MPLLLSIASLKVLWVAKSAQIAGKTTTDHYKVPANRPLLPAALHIGSNGARFVVVHTPPPAQHVGGKEKPIVGDRTPVSLDKVGITVVLNRLARLQNAQAKQLYGKLMSSWGMRPDRQRVTVKLGRVDLRLLQKLRLPRNILALDVLPSTGWVTTYQHPQNPQLEVIVRSKDKPSKRRLFSIGGKKRRLVAVHTTHLNASNHKEATRMATKTRKGKKAVEEDLDELEGLEDLEDLEDLDDEDVEEPEDIEDEDEDEDEDEGDEKPKRKRGKAKPAKASKKSSTQKRPRKATEDEDEDEDEDEEDEKPKRKRGSTKTSKTKKPSAKSSAKKDGKGNLPAARELPKGQVGPQEIAEMVGGNCDARYVRIWLRESEYEREDGSRWAFSKGEARTIAKEIKQDRREAGAS